MENQSNTALLAKQRYDVSPKDRLMVKQNKIKTINKPKLRGPNHIRK